MILSLIVLIVNCFGTDPFVSWKMNADRLSQIPTTTKEERDLIHFLQNRWLSKTAGFGPTLLPPPLQLHPQTSNSYARDPSHNLPPRYKEVIEQWQQEHPYPLILTVPGAIVEHFPTYFSADTPLESLPQDLAIYDFTSCPEKWERLSPTLEKRDHLICIKRVQKGNVEAICLLSNEEQHKRLLTWISRAGLTANWIELDRLHFEQPLPSSPLLTGSLSLMKGFFQEISNEKWEKVQASPVLSQIASISFQKIEQELERLRTATTLFEQAGILEQMHAAFLPLVEIFSPFYESDFTPILKNALTKVPERLLPHIHATVHMSAMTSLTAILKSLETEKPLHVLYGQNSYFETIDVAYTKTCAKPVSQASTEDWKEVDLLLIQFNPVIQKERFDLDPYSVEEVIPMVQKALEIRREKPLTVALDCTFDFIDSPRTALLLETFEREILEGKLTVICYRSGVKFDMWGLDNVCGAPFWVVSRAPHPRLFDPLYKTDTLSWNWFCLAYTFGAEELDRYRATIFSHSRQLLQRLPPSLFEGGSFRVIPACENVDPAFIDIKICGPLHSLKSYFLLAYLSWSAHHQGHPLFFRPSLGFYHPNAGLFPTERCSTIRLSLGLDPREIETFSRCLLKFA